MSKVQIPGAVWVIALALVNTLPAALQDSFPGALWLPLVIDLLLIVGKAIQVYGPKETVVDEWEPVDAKTFVPASALAPVVEAKKVSKFLLG